MYTPLKNNVLVKLIDKSKVTESGIVLTSADPLEANKAQVLVLGPTVEFVKENEVLLVDWKKARIIDKQDNLYVINEDDIVLVFDDLTMI